MDKKYHLDRIGDLNLLAQISLSLLLFTSLHFLYYFRLQLDAALLNCKLKNNAVSLFTIFVMEIWMQKSRKLPHLDSTSYFADIIPNVLLSSPFKGDFCAYNTHEDANFILCLVDLVIIPTENDV